MNRRNSWPTSSPNVPVGLLDLLLRHQASAKGAALPIASLAAELSLSSNQVLAQLDLLRHAGCEFDIHPLQGVTLLRTDLGVWEDFLRAKCAVFPERNIDIYRTTASTQDLIRRQIQNQGLAAQGCIAAADEQTAGRGRLGRKWIAPRGSALTFSIGIITQNNSLSVDRLTIATAVAVLQGLEKASDPFFNARDVNHQLHIKWPNDIMVGPRKLAGILVERFTSDAGPAAIIGIGINVALTPEQLPADQPALRQRVTSLHMEQIFIDRLAVFSSVIQALDEVLPKRDTQWDVIQKTWSQHCRDIGSQRQFMSDGKKISGTVISADPQLGLIVRRDDGAIVNLQAETTSVVVKE